MANLDDVDAELAELARHHLKLSWGPDSALIGAQLMAEYVVEFGQIVAATDRTWPIRCDAMVLGGPQQVGVGVAQVGDKGVAPPQLSEGSAALQGVVDDGALRPRSGRRG